MRIAHLTDLHLRQRLPGTAIVGRRRSRDIPSFLVHALRNARERGAEVVVLTGDLVDVPLYLLTGNVPGCMNEGRWLAAMEEDYRLIKEMLDASGLPYIAMPGNHDSYEVVDRVFGAQPYVREIGELTFVSFWDREDRQHVPRRHGAERDLFDQVLTQSSRPQVHLQHFVITPELNQNWPHTYSEGEELRRHIVGSGTVRLSLSGHYHPGTDLIQDAGSAFSAGSALAEPPHCYRLYDIDTSPEGALAPVGMHVVPLLDGGQPRPAAFIDYTACLTVLPRTPSELNALRLRDGVAAALADLANAGYTVVALIDPGWATELRGRAHLLDAVLDRIAELLLHEGAVVEAGYFPMTVSGDVTLAGPTWDSYLDCRWPSVFQAADELRLDLARSCLIGPGVAAGSTTPITQTVTAAVCVGLGGGERPTVGSVSVHPDLPRAVAHVLAGD